MKTPIPSTALLLTGRNLERYAAKLGEPDGRGCVNWLGRLNPYGYGSFDMVIEGRNRVASAHRIAWALAHGAFDDTLEVDHVCSNRPCANVEHLRLATHAQNLQHRTGAQRNNPCGVRGVYWDPRAESWCCRVYVDDKAAWNKRFSPRRLGVSRDEALRMAEAAVTEVRLRLYTHSDPALRAATP